MSNTYLFSKSPLRYSSAYCALLTALICTPPATAQDAQDSENAQNDPFTEEFLVTARRRTESLQEVPVSVTAFSADGLLERNISNLQGITNFTPNLELNAGRPDAGSSSASIYIRGVGQYDFLFPNDPGVGLYLNDVYLARTVGGMLSLADIERVEVLRGPQGTLYGKNTIGGAVKVITRAPSFDEFSGKIQATAGSFNRTDVIASVNLPISDSVAVRIEGASLQRDGFVTRPLDNNLDLGNEDRDLVRLDALWEPNERLRVRFGADWQRQRQNQGPGILLAVVPSTAGATPLFDAQGNRVIDPVTNKEAFVPGTGLLETLYNPVVAPFLVERDNLPPGTIYDQRFVSDDPFVSFGTAPAVDNNDIWGVSLVLDYELSDTVDVKSITAYRELDAFFARDSDASPLNFTSSAENFDQSQFSQELQFSGTSFGDRLNWLAGLYWFNETGRSRNNVQIYSGTFETVGLEIDLIPNADITSNSFAGFFNTDYEITDKLSVTLGLRYTYETKKLERDFRLTQSGQIITIRQDGIPDSGDPLAAIGPALRENWDAFSPKIGLDYQLNDDVLLYFSASRGFKSGGWSPRPQIGTENAPFDQEFLNTIEVGAKTEWFDSRVIFNAAAFYSIYEDIQITIIGPDPSGSGALILPVVNAGEAEIYGAEFELQARPTPNWDIQAGLGLLSTGYTSLDPATGIQPGARLPEAPTVTFNASAQYTWEVGDVVNIALRGGTAYKSRTFKDPFNNNLLAQPGFWLFDASLGFEAPDGQWRLAIVGSNLTDKVYITNGVDADALGFIEAYRGRPREYAVNLTFNF